MPHLANTSYMFLYQSRVAALKALLLCLIVNTAQAGLNVGYAAKRVEITEARETTNNQTRTDTKTAGISVGVSNAVLGAAQGINSMAQAAKQTDNTRAQLLAGAAAGLTAYNTATDIVKNPGSATQVSVAVTASISKSTSQSQSQTDTARGSNVSAGGNVNIKATGDGENSDVVIQGSKVSAGKNVKLKADDDLLLLASKDSTSERSSNKSTGMNVGVSVGTGGMGVTIGASKGKGAGNGESTTYNNTSVQAGNTVTLDSGNDTTLKGANVGGKQVIANIGTNPLTGGNLTIESLQDTATYQSKQQNASGSITLGPAPGGSVSLSQSKVNSTYTSVGTQSGIATGVKDKDGNMVDGGFQINVQGNTTLTGGKVTSTDTASNAVRPEALEGQGGTGKNTFNTQGTLTTTDLQNQAQYSAKSVSLTAGTSGGGGGVGSASGNAASTTQSGITGITNAGTNNGAAGNAALRTGDAETAIKPIFDKDKVTKDVQAQTQITQQFGMQASKTVGDYGAAKTKPIDDANKYQDLKAKQDAASNGGQPLNAAEQRQLAELEKAGLNPQSAQAALNDPQNKQDFENWKEGGAYRLAAHAVVGGLTGGNLQSALGAATSQAAIPLIGEQIAALDIPVEMKKLLIQAAGTAIGAATGGTGGAVAGQNATANNYLKHVEINKLVAANKACSNGDKQACGESKALNDLDQKRQQALDTCQGNNSAECNGVRSDAASDMQGLSLYKDEIKKLVASGEMSSNAANVYLNKADIEIKDIANHLKNDYYVKSGGVADPNNPDYIKYKVLESATNGQELGGALTGAPTAGPSETTMRRVTEPGTSRAGVIDTSPNTRMTADQDLPNVYDNQQQRTVTKVQEETEALNRIGDNARNDTSNLNNNINLRGEIDKERAAASAAGFVRPDGTTWHPANDGVNPGTERVITLPVGTAVDRRGGENSFYVAPAGTIFENRVLPDTQKTMPLHTFEVISPIDGVIRCPVRMSATVI